MVKYRIVQEDRPPVDIDSALAYTPVRMYRVETCDYWPSPWVDEGIEFRSLSGAENYILNRIERKKKLEASEAEKRKVTEYRKKSRKVIRTYP